MKVALVTGASRGLGRKLALALSLNGYSVAANYLSSDKEAAALAEEMGPDSLVIRADVGDITQVRKIAGEIEKKFGRLDAIINNAGITRDNLLLRQSEEEWDRTIQTNLKGCFNVITALAPLMIRSGGGHIINISSYSGVKGKPGQAAYSASKAALLGLTRTSAAEFAEYRIRVNAILPGYLPTGMGTKAEDAMEKAKGNSLLQTLSDPAEVAEFILFLLRTEHITGQVFGLESRIV